MKLMARGWESKSVESQMEEAESRRAQSAARQPTPEQLARQSLELSRTRVLHDLAAATNPRYRAQLKAALKYLDEKIAALSTPPGE